MRNFILLTNTIRQSIKHCKAPMVEFIPKGAKKFSHVKIGSIADAKYSNEIVSFFDKDNNLIGRVARETGKPDIYTEYGAWQFLYSADNTISRKYRTIKRIAVSRNKATPDVPRKIAISPPYSMHRRKFDLTKDYYNMPMFPKNNKYTKLLSEELQYINTSEPKFNLAKMSEEAQPNYEYVGIKRKYGNNPEVPDIVSIKNNIKVFGRKIYKKFTDIFLKKEAKDVKIKNVRGNIGGMNECAANNPCAPYMYLRPAVKAKYLTKYFAKQRGLTSLNIKSAVEINNGNTSACFAPYEGKVYYRMMEYIKPSTAAHEIEHGYHHALNGQNGCANPTPYEKRALNILGECPKNKKREADMYHKAIEEYPKRSDFNNEDEYFLAYLRSKLEKCAWYKQSLFEKYDEVPFGGIIASTGF